MSAKGTVSARPGLAVLSPELPEAARGSITAFTVAARRVFADDLLSVVLFGSAAEGRMRQTPDVNMVVVLRAVDPMRLEEIGEAYRLAHAAIRLSAMFILESEIAVAKDAFAVKFADIVARHQVLHGSDPFAGLAISREPALHRLLQVLVNLQLRPGPDRFIPAQGPHRAAVWGWWLFSRLRPECLHFVSRFIRPKQE
jgi:predicted nucleotidyltransferase